MLFTETRKGVRTKLKRSDMRDRRSAMVKPATFSHSKMSLAVACTFTSLPKTYYCMSVLSDYRSVDEPAAAQRWRNHGEHLKRTSVHWEAHRRIHCFQTHVHLRVALHTPTSTEVSSYANCATSPTLTCGPTGRLMRSGRFHTHDHLSKLGRNHCICTQSAHRAQPCDGDRSSRIRLARNTLHVRP